MRHVSFLLLSVVLAACSSFPPSPLVGTVERTRSQREDIAFLREKLRSGDRPTRGAVANQLALLGAFEAIPDFREILHDDDRQMASFAIAGLRELGATEAVADIRPYLESQEPGLRVIAAGALMVLADDEPIDSLLDLATTGNIEVRRLLCQSLLLFADQRSRPALLILIEDHDREIRSMAIMALGRVGDPSDAERIELLLTSTHHDLRISTLRALAQLAPADYRPEFEAALRSDDRSEQEAALLGLIALRDPMARRHLLRETPDHPALNLWLMPKEIIDKLEATRLPLRDIRWLSFAKIAAKISAATDIKIELGDSAKGDPRRLFLDSSSIALGLRPDALTLLSLPRFAWQASAGIEWSWILVNGRIRYVSPQEATEFFRDR